MTAAQQDAIASLRSTEAEDHLQAILDSYREPAARQMLLAAGCTERMAGQLCAAKFHGIAILDAVDLDKVD